ncbi:MAG: rod shape-determining protein MreC, partial [Cyanobacteriota bacterium erpe_2018_sw_21hr_WHONDRS-SW48-000092_B_bin.40]|nr:rod shape-determining protein MreC [Cyanobacteriota bacterium erpe_2018_sw_21hr_WHONDRS-SW48-000092_B_bin.40]
MAVRNESDLEAQSQSVAEYLFLIMLVLMVAVPVSGMALSVSSWFSSIYAKGEYQFVSTKNLAEQLLNASTRIRSLESKLAQNELELARLKQESRDTSRLRSLLGLKSKAGRVTVSAEVVARNPDNWFEQVVIDKGSADKITVGSAVISISGVVGQVVRVSEHDSVVRLATDPEQKEGVLISKL